MSTVGAGVIGTGQAQYLDVVLQGGRTYSFSVHPSEPNVDFDLHIYDQNGNLVAWDESPVADAYGVVTPIITGAVSNPGQRGLRNVHVSGRGVRLSDQRSAKTSNSMCTSPTRSKPRRSRIGRDIEPPCVIRAGVPSATASSQRARISAR